MCRWHCLSANMCLYLHCVLYVVCTCTNLKQTLNTQTKEQVCRGRNKCGMFCKSPAPGPASSLQISQQNEVHGCQRAKTSERESASASSTTCGIHRQMLRQGVLLALKETKKEERPFFACPFLFPFSLSHSGSLTYGVTIVIEWETPTKWGDTSALNVPISRTPPRLLLSVHKIVSIFLQKMHVCCVCEAS